MPDTLLDVILDETRRRAARPGVEPDWVQMRLWVEAAQERRRLALLAERSGPKGALAGHLDDLLRHA